LLYEPGAAAPGGGESVQMRGFVLFLLTVVIVSSVGLAQGQTPQIMDVSDVIVGGQKLATTYLLAIGQWSDSSDAASIYSAEIHCYKRFGFCEVASADSDSSGGSASVFMTMESFEIVRWDEREMIAIQSSPICVVNTLRADLVKRQVTLSSTSKGETKDKMCERTETPTAFLGRANDGVKRILKKAKKQ